MEYYLCRAMEVCRLNSENLEKLQLKERKMKRGLNSFEIQEVFGLPPLKEYYGIPDHDPSMSAHNQKLRGDFRTLKLMPRYGDLVVGDFDEIHKFDENVRISKKLNLHYQGPQRTQRLSASVDGGEK